MDGLATRPACAGGGGRGPAAAAQPGHTSVGFAWDDPACPRTLMVEYFAKGRQESVTFEVAQGGLPVGQCRRCLGLRTSCGSDLFLWMGMERVNGV